MLSTEPELVDLLVRDAVLVATMNDGRELAGGWVAMNDGFIVGSGALGDEPQARETISARDCLVTPGLINVHHHIFQNLTRSYLPSTGADLFGWLSTLYPLWSGLDEEAAYLSAFVGLAELALGGCTTSTDHLYVHPKGAGDLLGAEIAAARELGFRFHPTRGSMSRSVEDGGLPPASVCEDEETILSRSEEAVRRYHDPTPGAMVRVALAPCSPFSVTPRLMRATAELAERLDVRLHTHLAEDPDEDRFCLETHGCRPIDLFEQVGWLNDRSWVAHCVYPNADEIVRLGQNGVGVAPHCPSSNLMIAQGLAPVRELVAAGAPVGLGCDGSSSTDAALMWLEARTALLLGRLRHGPTSTSARDALALGTLGSARCLGRSGELGVLRPGAVGDLVCWPLTGVAFAGAHTDAIEAWLRCGPVASRHTIIAGRAVVADGALVNPKLEEILTRHKVVSRQLQHLD